MTEPRLPLMPRIGYALLFGVLVLLVLVFALLALVLPDDRFKFIGAAAAMLFGITWVRGARRSWFERQRGAAAAPESVAPTGTQAP